MPFLRLTRDRRGFENTYLMHADRPGERPRLLYWYRTAPGILLGRAPLDEDAIRTIEEQHPDIDFDWPAILALSEVMTPEEEAPAPRRERKVKPQRQRERRPDTRVTDDGACRDVANRTNLTNLTNLSNLPNPPSLAMILASYGATSLSNLSNLTNLSNMRSLMKLNPTRKKSSRRGRTRMGCSRSWWAARSRRACARAIRKSARACTSSMPMCRCAMRG